MHPDHCNRAMLTRVGFQRCAVCGGRTAAPRIRHRYFCTTMPHNRDISNTTGTLTFFLFFFVPGIVAARLCIERGIR